MGFDINLIFIEPLKEVKELIETCGNRSFNLSDIKNKYDENGIKLCKWCGKAMPDCHGNMKYCSNKCSNSAYIYTTPHHPLPKKYILNLQGNKCNICGVEFNHKNCEFDLDHIVPIWCGGSIFDLKNRQMICKKCHKEKTKRERNKL